MSQSSPSGEKDRSSLHHPRFAAFYEWMTQLGSSRRFTDPLRQELVGQATGVVLEIGAGNGLNFPFYDPARCERVEATEPDPAMLRYARQRLNQARVPVQLTAASIEALPFADHTFDSVVVTLVFCSVADPVQGFHEIKRVLKPGGILLMLEHVRAQGAVSAGIQNALVPVTTRLAGNCHWNRDTAQLLTQTGFHITQQRQLAGGLQPVISLQAIAPA
ncbi:methyltransferase type 11 [Dictyobacter alpinus]|uniref:Methyltransferase type 11 n=1 Tax=Dictyobacter alpinus TaxID=2014873 RepID=A0A402BCP4_9CHLR|nr:class I SAM-dependent methyltransferase [Dictyobacter alpinus]GCE29052.1 methyltransferase type 11 [Dictyobacter alpinus]